jgi:hypothetical protein
MSSPPSNTETNHDRGCGAREGISYCLPKGYIHLLAELQIPPSAIPGIVPNANTNSVVTNAVVPAGSNTNPSYYKITIDVTIVPDGSNLFLLQPRQSAWAHDTLGITVQNGLLTSVGSTNADQTGAAVLKIAELAGLIATAVKGPMITAAPVVRPPRIEMMFTPDEADDSVNGPNSALRTARLEVHVIPNFPNTGAEERASLPVDAKKRGGSGIFYRPLLPYTLILTDHLTETQYRTVVLLPNDGPILSLVPRRATLVTARTGILFDHGCPTALSLDRDSIALAWASLPVDIVKAFLSAPAELVQLKLNLANTNAQLGAAELNNLNNQLAILKAQVAIHQFMLTNSAATAH